MKKSSIVGIILLFSTFAQANRLIVTVNPADCVACQAALYDTVGLRANFQSVTIVFPSRFREDSETIFQKYPVLNNMLFHYDWNDHPFAASFPESISMAYYLDNSGNVLKKLPLKLFSPGNMLGFAPQKDNHILFEDTIRTTNKLPASISHFLPQKGRLYFVDNLNDEILYMDWQAKEKTLRTIKTEAFTSNSYQTYYGDQANLERLRNEAILKREQAGSLSKIAGVSECNGILYVTFKYNYINGFLLQHFDVAYAIAGDHVVDYFLIVNPVLAIDDKVTKEIAKEEGITDSTQLSPERAHRVGRELDSLIHLLAAKTPNAYHATTYDVFALNDSEYALPARMNAPTFSFVGLYHQHGHKLVPEGKMLKIEKGKIYKESANYNHFQTLCGRFPYFMHRISNCSTICGKTPRMSCRCLWAISI